MIPFDFIYCRPDSLKEASDVYIQLRNEGKTAVYYAGGSEIITMCRSGSIRLGPKNVIATFGEFHPKTLEALDASGPLCGFEVYVDAVPEPKARPTRTRSRLDLSPFQAVRRDFAFVVVAERRGGRLGARVRCRGRALGRRTGGGGRSRLWTQIIANLIDKELIIMPYADACTGAALMAAIGTGLDRTAMINSLWDSVDPIRVKPDGNMPKDLKMYEKYTRVHGLLDGLYLNLQNEA